MRRWLLCLGVLLALVVGSDAQSPAPKYTLYVSTYYGGYDATTQYVVLSPDKLDELIAMLQRVRSGQGRYAGGTYDGFWLNRSIWISSQVYP